MDTFTQNFSPSTFFIYVRATYKLIGERTVSSKKDIKNVLDIGTATGHPLNSIIDSFKTSSVVGIDINQSYIAKCKQLFQSKPNVEIRHMNYYDL
jgi:ubiquinone/menaquinone biosynthesis C-methylase UbiE